MTPADAMARIRELGLMPRYTQWTGGHMAGAYHPSHPAKYGDSSAWRKVEADRAAVGVTADLAQRFLDHLRNEGRARTYRQDAKRYLEWWATQLSGRDLRTVTLSDLNRMLDASANRKGRIIALKSFCSWLRGRGDLHRNSDPTLDLLVPKPVAAKDSKAKGHSMDAAMRAYRVLEPQLARDVMRVRWNTGKHGTELTNLVDLGEVVPVPGLDPIAGVLRFWHKKRQQHIQSVDAPTLAAAQRLKDRGSVPGRNWMQERLDAACKAARVDRIAWGAVRHSFVTWARTHGEEVKPAAGGVPLSAIASAIGHQSSRTTARFYDETQVPPMVRIPALVLEHPDDPRPIAIAVRERR